MIFGGSSRENASISILEVSIAVSRFTDGVNRNKINEAYLLTLKMM